MAIDPVAYARRWKTLVVLSLSLLIIGLDNTILNVALPSLQEEFDASSSTLQWMVDSYLLVFASLLLTMGTIGDRFGRKKSLIAGLAIFGGASLAVLLVETSGQLIAVRAVMGIGGALIMPATLSVISNVFPREERGKAIAIWSAMAAIGVGLGPLFGGLLIEYADWTWVFLINVPIAFIALVAAIRLVPESRDPEPGSFDFGGVLLSIGALVALVYGIIEAPEHGWTAPLTLGCFAAAAGLGAAFIAWELRREDPMLNLSYFKDSRFSVASFGIGLAFFCLMGGIFASTQYLQDAHGYSALEAGAAMLPVALGLVMGSGSSIKLVARFGTANVMRAGLLGVAVTLTSTLLWTPDSSYLPIGLFFYFMALSMGWIMGPGTSSVMSSVPEEKAGVASAMNDVTRQVGGALGTAILGSILTSIYASKMADSVAGLPTGAGEAAQDSVGQANAVAESVPAGGSALADAAAVAFTDAMGIAFLVAAGIAVVTAAVVKLRLPAGQGIVRQPEEESRQRFPELPAGTAVEGRTA
jgi:EmrB/QacA subfamily drug resistance transporter